MVRYTTLAAVVLLQTAAHAGLLTLAEAEHAAVTTGFAVRAAHFAQRSAEWGLWNAAGGYLPTASFSSTYMRMDKETVEGANFLTDMFSALGPAAPVITDQQQARSGFGVYEESWKHSFTFGQSLSNGGAEVFGIAMARHARTAAELQSEAARQQAIYDTRKAYLDALAARERTALSVQTLAWVTENLATARIRHEAGTVPVTDVLQWEAEAAAKEGDVLQAQAFEHFALLTLFQAMGTPVSRADTTVQLQPFDHFEQWYRRGPAAVDGTPDSNPVLRSVQEFTTVARIGKRMAAGRLAPGLNAFASYGWPSWKEFVPPGSTESWTVGLSATVPLFNGTRTVSGYEQALNDYRAAVVDEQNTTNRLAVNLERVRSFYRAAFGSVDAAKRQHGLMEKQLEIMQQRYEAGMVNQSQLLEVELGMRSARMGYIQALVDCLLLETEYRLATGSLETQQ